MLRTVARIVRVLVGLVLAVVGFYTAAGVEETLWFFVVAVAVGLLGLLMVFWHRKPSK